MLSVSLTSLSSLRPPRWWRAGMSAITWTLLEDVGLPKGAVLEIGCGEGEFAREMARRFARRPLYALDLNPHRLLRARRIEAPPIIWMRADLHDLPLAPAAFALVAALDVWDQQGVSMPQALLEARRVLRPRGALLLRVSAHPQLYGSHDRAFGTGRRFRADELRSLLQDANFKILRLTHANSILLPAAATLRAAMRLGRLDPRRGLAAREDENAWLARVLRFEARLLRRRDLPLGLSLYALATKESG